MGGLLILGGLAGFLFGIVNLVRPLGRLRIETRAQAGAVVAGSLVVVLIGGAFLPADDDDPEALAQVTTTSVSSSTSVGSSTTTPRASSTTSIPTTSTSLATSTTSPSSSTTTTGGETLALDLLMTIPIELETPAGYDRDLFPHWSDEDGDTCDTREEVLIRDADGTADVGWSCAVTTGFLGHPRGSNGECIRVGRMPWGRGVRECVINVLAWSAHGCGQPVNSAWVIEARR